MSTIGDLEALLRTHRDDWDSWRVYADYLTDRGDDHGKLILLQHQLATRPLGLREKVQLEEEIRQIARRHRWEGDGPLRAKEATLEWFHGFLWSARLEGGSAVKTLQTLLQQPYVQFLGSLTFWSPTRRELEQLPDLLGRLPLHTLILTICHLPADLLGEILGKVGELRHLQVTLAQLGSKGAAVVATSKNLRGLRFLDLLGNSLGPEGMAELAHTETLNALTALRLSSNKIEDNGAMELARSSHLQSVRSLHLAHNNIEAAGALALARSQALPALAQLDLRDNALDLATQQAFAAARPGVEVSFSAPPSEEDDRYEEEGE